jgi:hypothetical protein
MCCNLCTLSLTDSVAFIEAFVTPHRVATCCPSLVPASLRVANRFWEVHSGLSRCQPYTPDRNKAELAQVTFLRGSTSEVSHVCDVIQPLQDDQFCGRLVKFLTVQHRFRVVERLSAGRHWRVRTGSFQSKANSI